MRKCTLKNMLYTVIHGIISFFVYFYFFSGNFRFDRNLMDIAIKLSNMTYKETSEMTWFIDTLSHYLMSTQEEYNYIPELSQPLVPNIHIQDEKEHTQSTINNQTTSSLAFNNDLEPLQKLYSSLTQARHRKRALEEEYTSECERVAQLESKCQRIQDFINVLIV